MFRTSFIVLVLAAFSAAALGAPPGRTAKAHKHTHPRSAAQGSAHAAPRSATRHASIQRHPSPIHPSAPAAGSRHPLPQPSAAPPAADPVSAGPTVRAASLHRRRPAPMPPPLLGSLESLERQNQRVDADGLERILDNDDLNHRIAQKLLVPVPVSPALAINQDLPPNHRYCRPWTARFLLNLARAHAARFGRPLEVSSAVRTVDYQKQLMLTNGNAAAAEGDIVSPHIFGASVDVAKGTMARQEIGWIRSWLLPLQLAGKIDVEEEFQQACFHIAVYKDYMPAYHPAPRRPSQAHTGGAKERTVHAPVADGVASQGL